jgi:hypothetical protein
MQKRCEFLNELEKKDSKIMKLKNELINIVSAQDVSFYQSAGPVPISKWDFQTNQDAVKLIDEIYIK